MHVLKENRKESARYRLVEYDGGKKVYPYSYGKDQPTFYEPDFRHGIWFEDNPCGVGTLQPHR
jgi:hypothetical protein